MEKAAKTHHVVRELIALIKANHWEDKFDTAIKNARKKNIPDLADINNLQDYLQWINNLLYWIPSENYPGRNIYNHLCKFYFILDQEPVLALQNKVIPHDKMPPLYPLSAWMVKYANAMGQFLDTEASLTEASEKSFYDSPSYNMQEYLRPHGGWKTFNQIFARHYKHGAKIAEAYPVV